MLSGSLPADVQVRPLIARHDQRGVLFELSRNSWEGAVPVAQWNALQSQAGVLRGMAVHCENTDVYLALEGRALLGLADLRSDSPSFRARCVVELDAKSPLAVTIPVGIAHGLYFETDALVLAALSRRFDAEDKLGCCWDDPWLAIPWPSISPRVLARDQHWPSAKQLVEQVSARLAAAKAADC
nr:dTDP-4-dehydrorhamnose 3,5-epimerase family protein [Pseudomarimonas arenosa]